jgi:hypothetical protein
MNHKLSFLGIFTLFLILVSLAACTAVNGVPVTSATGEPLLLSMQSDVNTTGPCDGCAQATLEALQTQEKSNADLQAAATAEIMRVEAQATLDAVNATVSAAQTQEKNNANVVAAQVAATAAIYRANAKATLVSAGATQGAAQTQDAILQTQVENNQKMTADVATQNAIATVTQQNNFFLASGTQTAVDNVIATQTQSALATTQWYADQARQRDEQRQAPLTFLWLWCPPLFIVAIALVAILFFWRWMTIRENQQLIEMQAEAPIIIEHTTKQVSETPPVSYPLAKPADHTHWWLEEAKRKLLSREKDDNDKPGS